MAATVPGAEVADQLYRPCAMGPAAAQGGADRRCNCSGSRRDRRGSSGLPDQGITNLLMRAEEGVLFTLWAELMEWEPTIFVMPSSTDAHPDHSALFVLVHLALTRLERPPRLLLRFIIHPPRRSCERGRMTLRLTEPEIERKRAAILAHREPDGAEPETIRRLRDGAGGILHGAAAGAGRPAPPGGG